MPMTYSDIAHLRLLNQHISQSLIGTPAQVVEHLGAMQAQDYFGSKWAIGLRLQGAVDCDIEEAFNDGSILRTHLLRPTWHYVTPSDIRWMLALTASRVHAANAYMYRKLELDATAFSRSNAAIEAALEGGNQLTREELRTAIERAGVATRGELRLGYLMMHAELEGLVCSGPRCGKQFTYALLEERVLVAKPLDRDEALAELSSRFFISHGPATVYDLAKWSGLTVTEARNGLDMVRSKLACENLDGQTYWLSASTELAVARSPKVFLLPIYDEYTIGYKGHRAVFNPEHADKWVFTFPHTIVINGVVVGTWKRTLKKNAVVIETNTFVPLTKTEREAVVEAGQPYGAFLNLPVTMLD